MIKNKYLKIAEHFRTLSCIIVPLEIHKIFISLPINHQPHPQPPPKIYIKSELIHQKKGLTRSKNSFYSKINKYLEIDNEPQILNDEKSITFHTVAIYTHLNIEDENRKLNKINSSCLMCFVLAEGNLSFFRLN
ncbi:hypothetical protein ACKWTF_001342 [Chironomus riparius]